MKNASLIVVLILGIVATYIVTCEVLEVISGNTSIRGTVNVQVYPEKTATPKREWKEPEAGMLMTDFLELCNDGHVNQYDRVSVYESQRHKITTIRFAYMDSRAKNHCWGTFTFVDSQLDSIFRGAV